MEVEVGGNRSVDLAGTSLLVVGQMSFTVLGSLANNIVLITVKVRPVIRAVNESSRSFISSREQNIYRHKNTKYWLHWLY